MLRRLRETGPVVLVPLAWTFVAAAHLDVVRRRTFLIAHVVMATLLLAFVALSWSEMRSGALRTWRRVVAVGFGLTVAGAVGLASSPPFAPLLGLAVVGWMLLPAVGLWDTGRRVVTFADVYRAGGACSALGALVYVFAPLVGSTATTTATVAGLLLVGVGQTAGIVAAVVAD
jgi:hypothetical protein